MFIEVSNTKLFYVKQGDGEPIILIHGNGESHKIFIDTLIELSKNYTVYAIDMRGQGASDKIEELHYEDMANDIIEFIKTLNIKNPYYFGFSDGGIVGLIAASKSPTLFRKMLIAGANTHPKALKKSCYLAFKFWYFFTRNKIIKVMLSEPNISANDLQKICVNTVVLMGQHDCIYKNNGMFIAENIKSSKFIELKDETHSSYVHESAKLTKLLREHLLNN